MRGVFGIHHEDYCYYILVGGGGLCSFKEMDLFLVKIGK